MIFAAISFFDELNKHLLLLVSNNKSKDRAVWNFFLSFVKQKLFQGRTLQEVNSSNSRKDPLFLSSETKEDSTMNSKKMTIDPEEIGFALSIEVRKRNGKDVLSDITVDEIYSHNYCADESIDETGDDLKYETMKIFTEDELNTLIIYDRNEMELGYRGYNGEEFHKTYRFSSDKVTIKEFVDAIIDFEKITRSMGSIIDRHHIFFEGIEPMEDSVAYSITWGS